MVYPFELATPQNTINFNFFIITSHKACLIAISLFNINSLFNFPLFVLYFFYYFCNDVSNVKLMCNKKPERKVVFVFDKQFSFLSQLCVICIFCIVYYNAIMVGLYLILIYVCINSLSLLVSVCLTNRTCSLFKRSARNGSTNKQTQLFFHFPIFCSCLFSFYSETTTREHENVYRKFSFIHLLRALFDFHPFDVVFSDIGIVRGRQFYGEDNTQQQDNNKSSIK